MTSLHSCKPTPFLSPITARQKFLRIQAVERGPGAVGAFEVEVPFHTVSSCQPKLFIMTTSNMALTSLTGNQVRRGEPLRNLFEQFAHRVSAPVPQLAVRLGGVMIHPTDRPVGRYRFRMHDPVDIVVRDLPQDHRRLLYQWNWSGAFEGPGVALPHCRRIPPLATIFYLRCHHLPLLWTLTLGFLGPFCPQLLLAADWLPLALRGPVVELEWGARWVGHSSLESNRDLFFREDITTSESD